MCSVSVVGDKYSEKFQSITSTPWAIPYPGIVPYPVPSSPVGYPIVPSSPIPAPVVVSKVEFEALKKEVAEMKKQLEAAKAQDIADGTPDCEEEQKVALLKEVAKMVGVDLSGIWPDK